MGSGRFAKFLLAFVVAMLIAACGNSAPTATPAPAGSVGTTTGETYRVGFLASVTGKAATLGEPQRNVAVMLQRELDAAGGVTGPDGVLHPVEILVYDTQGNSDTAVTLARKLIGDDSVVAIVGTSTSPETMAILPIAQEAQVPLISMASSSAIVKPIGERLWVFKTAPSNEHTAPLQVQYVEAKGWTRIANLYVNNAYGEDGAAAIRETAKAEGVEIVYEDTFEEADTDMTAQITKIRASGAEAVLVTAINPAAAIFTRQARELGLTLPLVHNSGIANAAFIELAGAENAEGVIFPTTKIVAIDALPEGDPQREVLRTFAADYQSYANQPPNHFAGHAWDALNIVTAALSKLPTGLSLADQRSRLRDGIEATSGFAGIDGVFNLSAQDHVGLNVTDMVLVRISGGKWQYQTREQW